MMGRVERLPVLDLIAHAERLAAVPGPVDRLKAIEILIKALRSRDRS